MVVETRKLLLPPPLRSENTPQLRSRSFEDYQRRGVHYLVASSQSYGPYLTEPQKHPREYSEYMRIFEQSREVARFTPSPDGLKVPGPELRIYKVTP